MEVNSNSYIDLIRDCIILCKAIAKSDADPEMKELAAKRLSLVAINVNMNVQFSLSEERKEWQKLQKLMKGDNT